MPSQSFAYTGGWQTFTVPAGITSVVVELWGAGSGGVKGGYVKGNLAVVAGQKLYFACGGAGKAGAGGSTHAQAGGGSPYAGGGAGGQGYNAPGGDSGGGYTVCRLNATNGAIKAIAGGAGGSGGDGTKGGPGGNSVGGHGGNGDGTWGGAGGTQSSGGAGGSSPSRSRLDGNDGVSLSGGTGGGETSLNGEGGGGGGGGLYGGGGGTGASTGFQSTGGGAGGSSAWAGLTGAVATQGGGNSGNGAARVTYSDPDIAPSTPTSVTPAAGTCTRSTGSLSVSAHVSDPDGGTVAALFRTSLSPTFATYTDHLSPFVASGGVASVVITGFTQNAHWYMRVYAKDPAGRYSTAYASTDFYTNRPPNQPQLITPVDGDSGSANADAVFTWTFSDPDAGDTQSSAILSFRKHGSNDAWQTIAVTGSANSATIPADTLDPSVDYDWFVSYKDSGGLSSAAPSVTRLYHAAGPTAAPTLTPHTSPVHRIDQDITFDWVFNDPDVGNTQTKADFGYRLKPVLVDGVLTAPAWTVIANIVTTAHTWTLVHGSNPFDTDTEYEWSIRTYDSDNNRSPWGDPQPLQTITALDAPTITNPTSSEIVSSSTPNLAVSLPNPVPAWHPRKIEFVLATDAGFTSDIKDYIQSDAHFAVSQSFTDALPDTDAIDQTHTWHLRAREVDQFGQTSAWSAAISFTSSHPPFVLNFTPTGSHYEPRSIAAKFSWLFSSASGSSVQTAYQVQIQYANGTSFLAGTKTTSDNEFLTVDTSGVTIDSAMRWRVQVWDEDDVASGWSPWQAFLVGDAPTFTLSPVNGTTVTTGQPTISWTDLVIGGSRILAEWQVDFNLVSDGSLIYSSSGSVSTTRSFTPPQTILLNDQDYSVTVTITDTAGLSTVETSFFHTTFVVPDVLAYAVDISQVDTLGPVVIDWSESIPDDAITSWRVYRKPIASENWDLLAEIVNVGTTQYHDWLFSSGVNYNYTVTQVADREGALVESPLGFGAFYIQRRDNLAVNPNAGADASSWIAVIETGGGTVGALSRQTNGGPFNGTYVRQAWTAVSTTDSSGMGQQTAAASVAESDTITVALYVRPSVTQDMAAKIRWEDNVGTTLSVTIGAATLCPAGEWTRIFATGIAPADADHLLAYGAVVAGDDSQHWAIGNTLDAGALLISPGDQLYDYFDGSTPGGHWNGDVSLSTSYQTQIWNTEDTVYPVLSTQYWLVDPELEEASVMLRNATSAPLTEEYEQVTYEIIGRGRKVDYGTRLGFSGEIDCQLRGYDGTPALVRAKVELMRASQDTIYVRTPFGDLFPAVLGDTTFTPIAGVGATAMYDAAIPFFEVAK